jgi:hypothetical protein
VEYRPSSPTVNIRCGWSRVTDDAVVDSEKIASETITVDPAVIDPATHEVG